MLCEIKNIFLFLTESGSVMCIMQKEKQESHEKSCSHKKSILLRKKRK